VTANATALLLLLLLLLHTPAAVAVRRCAGHLLS